MHDSLPIHGKSVLFGLILMAALGTFIVVHSPKPVEPAATHLVVHQSGSTILGLTVTTKSGATLVDLELRGGPQTTVSVPAAWRESVTKAASGSKVAFGDAGLGFRNVTLPPSSHVRFTATEVPLLFEIQNPSLQPLGIRLERIDLDTKTVSRDSKLSTDPVILLR